MRRRDHSVRDLVMEPQRSRGMGLIGIEERVRELHGTFDRKRLIV